AVSSIDKRRGDWTTAEREAMHQASAVVLASSLRPAYLGEWEARCRPAGRPLKDPIIVDNNRDRRFLAIVREKFLELGSACDPRAVLVGKVRFRGSGPDELIQLADMICGATGAYLNGNDVWFQMIAARSLGVIALPQKARRNGRCAARSFAFDRAQSPA